jgi:DNA-binding transcriptional regulator LsrR (DeoR family)
MNHSPNITATTHDFTSLLSLLRTDERGEGLRSEEIAEQWGVSREKALTMLKDAKRLGLVRATKVKYTDLSDRETRVTGYIVEVRQ